MKKYFSIVFVICMVIFLSACNKEITDKNKMINNAGKADENGKYEIGLISDIGDIEDKSYNSGLWRGVKNYAEENNKSYNFYKSREKSDAGTLEAMDTAVKNGAKIIIVGGSFFDLPMYDAQTMYPDIKFLHIDGLPSKDGVTRIKDNVRVLSFAEEEAGYLAGYAVVKEGYTDIGYLGGVAIDPVRRYGLGFVQGANDAAKEIGLKKEDVSLRYSYLGSFEALPENETKAGSWFTGKTQVIFCAAGGAGISVMKSAEKYNKNVVGVDIDQSHESESVITSAMKNLQNTVYKALTDYYSGNFKGGTITRLNTSTNDVILEMENSKLKNFTKKDYDDIYKKLSEGKVTILTEKQIKTDAVFKPENISFYYEE